VAQPLEGADLAVVLANARETTLLPDGSHADGDAPAELVGLSAAMREFNDLLEHAAAARCHVLIIAERGFDSEAVAREIHRRSAAAASPFVALDCAGGDAVALERALLGSRDPNGRGPEDLEVVGGDALLLTAGHGTLFLGNIPELSASMQVRLARIARDGELRVADSTAGASVPRIVASTPPAIDGELEDGRLRPDLYRRLGILRLTLPPLRERPEDVPALAARLSRALCAEGGVGSRRFTNGALTLLSALPWPGNIEELSGVLSRVLGMPGSEVVGLDELLQHLRFDAAATRVAPNGSLSAARTRFEREYIAAVLHRHRWRMADAARALGIQRPNLYRKTRQLGITRTKRLP
jgi:DNA-binding NtrC family response regulator